jgi:hypothetical protein
MSHAPSHAHAAADTRTERLQPWIAALLSALLHLLLLWVLLHEAPPTFTTPQGAASGGRMKMEFIGKTTDPATQQPPSPPPTRAAAPPTRTPPKKRIVQRPPAAAPVQSTLVDHADAPVAEDTADIPTTTADDSWSMPSQSRRAPQQAQAPASPPPPSPNRSATWGRPPGMLEQDTAMDDVLGDSPSTDRGSQRDLDANGPSLEIGGYHAYYEPRNEAQVRAWMAQGMQEFFIPLPGTRYYMVCTLDIVLRRGSGKCRALDPDSPELQGIGDSRQIINMLQVYKQGQLVWKGPGPYR